MTHHWIILTVLLGLLSLPVESPASTGDVGTIIEKFIDHQFPEATGHYWVINETQWDGDEMIIDVHTIVKERRETEPKLSRFLLLIIAGELKGVQNIPLEPGDNCQPEAEA
jgi:hypothetical protein